MIPQLPSRNRTPRRRENTDGSTSSTFLASESSFNRSKSQAVEQLLDRRESITYKHEWRIEDVSQLAAHVEGSASASGSGSGSGENSERLEGQESPSEILRAGRKSADEMYKFDLGITTDEGPNASRHLSLYICSLLRSRETYHSPPLIADIFVGIIGTPKTGREYGSTDYLWSHTERFNFQPHDDFVKIRLPVLSTISQHPSIAPRNAFTLCIKIEQEYGNVPAFQREGHVSVPKDMVGAMAALIDVPNGADVRFVCLEHEIESEGEGEGQGGEEDKMRSRKRVIYANSQILASRSQYFQDLFATAFVETTQVSMDRFKTVVVESADFNTVYWMLRFLYTNELLFDEKDDHIRHLVTQQSISTSTTRSVLITPSSDQHHGREWDWRYLSDDYGSPLSATGSTDHDPRSIASSTVSSRPSKPSITIPTSTPTQRSTSRTRKPDPISPARETAISSRASSGSYSTSTTRPGGKGTYPRIPSETDPHSHPITQPHPACAMSIYMLAHQYRIEALEELARKHILSHLTHSSCIPVFLASYNYTDLHEQVLQYIHSAWKFVKGDKEFVRCFQEVARGEWGEEGGTLLADMVSRLPY